MSKILVQLSGESSRPSKLIGVNLFFEKLFLWNTWSFSRVVEIDDNLSKPDLRSELDKKKRYKSASNPR